MRILNNMDTRERDKILMRAALVCAREGLQAGEIPVGAVVADQYGNICGAGRNYVEANFFQGEHAEVVAIRTASQSRETWRLEGMTLYVTLEPCMMCVSLAALSKIERVVFGAYSPRFGASLDIDGVLRLYRMQIRNITPGVLADEALQVLRESFMKAREG